MRHPSSLLHQFWCFMPNPTFSIITVCLNAVDQLRSTLQSVREQSSPRSQIQHVIVDGGSTDGTLELLRAEHAAGNIDVWISEPDHGLYHAMNKGLALSTGDWISCLNAGDRYTRDAVMAVASAIGQVPADYYFGDQIFIDDRTEAVCGFFRGDLGRIVRAMPYPHSTLFVSRAQMLQLGGFDVSLGVSADFDLAWRLFDRGAIACQLLRPQSYFRTGGLSTKQPHLDQNLAVLRRHSTTVRRLIASRRTQDYYVASIMRHLLKNLARVSTSQRAKWIADMGELLTMLDLNSPSAGGLRRRIALRILQLLQAYPTSFLGGLHLCLRLAARGASRKTPRLWISQLAPERLLANATMPTAGDLPRPEFAGPHAGTQAKRRLIAISLYGTDARYIKGALENCRLAATVYPDWRVRLYLEHTIPASPFIEAGAEVIPMSRSMGTSGMFWRFLAAFDRSVERVIFRDADSRVNVREASAVAAWVASGKPMHALYDHPCHAHVAIMGGLWGVVGGALPESAHTALPQKKSRYNDDQSWIAQHCLPHLEGRILRHTSVPLLYPADPFPPHQPYAGYCGQRVDPP